jgi:hypothetical protein
MVGRVACLGVLFASIVVTPGAAIRMRPLQTQSALEGHVSWVVDSLKRMQSIKAGMTRADLLKLFTPDGGLQNGKIFVFRDCQYFKVAVEWEQPERVQAGRTIKELEAAIDGLPGDVIKGISRPYIEGMKID